MRLSIAFVLSLSVALGGCSSKDSGSSAQDASADSGDVTPAATAIVWSVSPGDNATSSCGAMNDTWSVGDTSMNPLEVVSSGSTSNGVQVLVACVVAPTATGFSVMADVQYGSKGSLSISGPIAVVGSAQPGVQMGVTGLFGDHLGLNADLSESDCTVTFNQNPNMGVAATRIWGVIDCPHATASDGTVCDATAQFLFENCGG